MPVTDALLALQGTPSTPSNIFTTYAGPQYSDDEIDFGVAADGSTTPYLVEFPSRTEKGYTFPPEQPGNGGVEMGVHVIIGAVLVPGSMTAGSIGVYTSASSSATTSIASRAFTLAQLAVAGAHYFIPVPGMAVLRYLRIGFSPTTAVCTSGTAFCYYGPRAGGEQ
jgi:hypothetical protein